MTDRESLQIDGPIILTPIEGTDDMYTLGGIARVSPWVDVGSNIEVTTIGQGIVDGAPSPTMSGVDCQAGDLLIAFVAIKWTYTLGTNLWINFTNSVTDSDMTTIYDSPSGHCRITAKQATGNEQDFHINKPKADTPNHTSWQLIRVRGVDLNGGVMPLFQTIIDKEDSLPAASPLVCPSQAVGNNLPAVAINFVLQENGEETTSVNWGGVSLNVSGQSGQHVLPKGQVDVSHSIITTQTDTFDANFNFEGDLACAALHGQLVWKQGTPNAEDGIVFQTNFDEPVWHDAWNSPPDSELYKLSRCAVRTGPTDGVTPRTSHMLEIAITVAHGHFGVGPLAWDPSEHFGYYPDELYYDYWLALGDSFTSDDSDRAYEMRGKIPGFGGMVGSQGGGGNPSDGTNGWSCRGRFAGRNDSRDVDIGTYLYHADMPGQYGEVNMWTPGGAPSLVRGQWYQIGWHLRMNTRDGSDAGSLYDGVIHGWINQSLVYTRNNLRFSFMPSQGINKGPWLHLYHGGQQLLPDRDMYSFYSEVRCSTTPLSYMTGV